MAIGVIIMTGVIGAAFGNQSYLVASATNDDAVAVGKGAIELLQALGRQDFNLVNSTTSTETRGGITYSKVTTVTLLSDYLTKAATTTVSWIGEHGQSLSTVFTTLIADLSNVNSPQSCNSSMTNVDGWKSPLDTPFDFQQLLYGNNSSGLVLTSVYALYKKLYVVASSPPSNPNDAETFFVLDISGANPVFLGSLDNDADNGSTYGLNDVTVASTSSHIYAFLANNHDNDFYYCAQSAKCAQLQVVDATNPAAPPGWSPMIANLKLATSTAPFVYGNHPTAANQAVGNAVFYANGYLYLGLTTTQSGAGFHVIDVGGGAVGGSPTNPKWVASWPAAGTMNGVSSGAPINGITVKGKYAYVSHPNGLVGATSEQLTVLDISSPGAPTRVSGFSRATGVANAAGKSSMIVGPNLYFGRTASNNSAADAIAEFYQLDASDPTSIPATPVGSLGLAISEGINNLVVRDFLGFLLTTTEFKVINISNPSAITTWGSLALPGHGGSSFDCDGDRFFVIHDVNKDFVSIVTPSPPTDFTLSNSGSITVNPGSSGNTTITRTAVLNPVAVTLAVSGLPAGATATWANNPCTPTCNSTLTISTTLATAPGTYPITVTGSPNGTSNPSTTFNLVVTGFDYSLSSSNDITVVQGGSGATTVTRTLISPPVSGVTIAAAGLPFGASATYVSNGCSPTCSGTLTISTTAATPPGTYPITVTGTPNGSSNPSVTFNLVVNAPFDYSLANSGPLTIKKGNNGTFTVTSTLVSGGTTPVTLAVGVLPSKVSVLSQTPGSCSPGCVTTIVLRTLNSATPGTYTVAITGSPNGTGPRSTTLTLIITN